MLTCPHCQRTINDRAVSVCPHCGASLNPVSLSAAPAAAPSRPTAAPLLNAEAGGPGNARRGARVSLTGEVLDDAPVSAAPAVGNAYVPPAPRLAPPAARREAAPDNSGTKAFILNMSVALVFLAVCIGGGGWYWTHRTNPKAQVTRYLHAVQWLDWGVVYDLSASPPGNKSRHEFASQMDDKFDSNPVLKIGARKSMEKIALTVGEPVIRGDEATVSVTRGATAFSDAKTFPLTLTNYGGVWKIHPLGENPLEMLHDPDEDKKAAGALLRSLLPPTPGSAGASSSP